MEKVANYSEDQRVEMLARYAEAPVRATVEAIAQDFGKPFRSVVAKLVREGVYVAAPRVAKDGSPVIRKEQLVEQIESLVGVKAPSLQKASKQDLQAVVEALAA